MRLFSLSDLDSYRTTPAAETSSVRHSVIVDTTTPVIPIYEYTLYTQFLSIRDWFLDMLHSDPVGQDIEHREIARQMIAKHLEDPEHHASLPLEFRHVRGDGGWRAGGD